MSEMKDIDLKVIFGEAIDELGSDQQTQIQTKIGEIVTARVAALEFDLKEQIEAEAKMKYETQLAEKTAELDKNLQDAEQYVIEKAESFKNEIIEKSQAEVEAVREETAKEIAEAKETAATEVATIKEEADLEVTTFKNEIVKKVDEYLDYELDKKMPEEITESLAKLSIYEPIVESIRGAFATNYIKIDEESFSLLKDAKAEILKLEGEVKEITKESIEHKAAIVNFKRDEAISAVCEGLTEDQRDRAKKLLEGYDPEEVSSKFNQIRDIIIESNESNDDTEELSESDASASDSDDTAPIAEDVDVVDADVDVVEEEKDALTEEQKEILGYANDFKELW
jgi:hypothetical protein